MPNNDCPDWPEGRDTPRARTQRIQVLARIIDRDCKRLPTAKMVRSWHREMFDGLAPHSDYLGNFRDLQKVPKCLQHVNAHVGGIHGLPYDQVLDAVDEFIEEFRARVKRLDQMWKDLGQIKTVFAVDQMIKLAAWAHGEWVRIHPFANGNGRTSRLWVNYVFSRFGFPPIAVRPRPGSPYDLAAEASMRYRDHDAMESVLWELAYDEFHDLIQAVIRAR